MGIKEANVAALSADQIQVIQNYEQEFKTKFGSQVILLAVNDKK